jgi:HAD superfamily hydrolase (TIGR01509 family)
MNFSSGNHTKLRFAALETVFLDAGNTLIGLDLDWVVEELTAVGLELTAERFARGEAAARPVVSAALSGARGQSGVSSFEFYLTEVLTQLGVEDDGLEARVANVSRRLKAPGQDFRLWSRVLPGVPDALAMLHDLGLRLVVVSNSDGSVERGLDAAGLADRLSLVVDSEVVGFEKPDPRLFRHALESVGADPVTTVHVGDMYYQDVVGARAAGIDAVLLDPHDDWDVDDCIKHRSLYEFASTLKRARPGTQTRSNSTSRR